MANSQSNQLLKFLRPLLFFVVVLLALLGYREHKKWMERTCINFTVTLAGQSLMYGVEAKLDGVLVTSGRRIALGKHTLIITHPKAETFTTNFFGWYGGLDCGSIDLKRAQGSLNVSAHPPAQTITITIRPDQSVYLNTTPMTMDKLEAGLEKLKVGPKNVVTINADERVPHGTVIAAMDEARKAGVVAFGFATNRK